MKPLPYKITLTPKLRFPEFRDAPEWKRSVLAKVSSVLKGKGISKSDITPDGIQPCIRYGELYTHYGEIITSVISRTNIAADELFLSKANDVIIPSSGETKIDIAKASCVLHDGIALGSDLNIIRSTLNGAFLSYYLNGPKRYDIAKIAQGDAVVHLYPDQIEKLDIFFPQSAEQHKIASCLSLLDELIAAERHKLDALKAYKKGLMQHLFPRENETCPRLRFPEFRNAPEWRRSQLKTLLFETKARNRTLKYGTQDVLSVSGDFGCVNQIEHLGRSYAGITVKDYHIVETGDIVYTKSPLKRNPYGIIKVNKGRPGIVSTLYAVYRTYESCHPDYIDYYFSRDFELNRYLQPIVRKGAKNDMKVNNSAVLTGEVRVPKPSEQKRIVEFFDSLGDLITAQAANIEALKTHKMGLIQQLFPSPEGQS